MTKRKRCKVSALRRLYDRLAELLQTSTRAKPFDELVGSVKSEELGKKMAN